jgi:hypothetical protein
LLGDFLETDVGLANPDLGKCHEAGALRLSYDGQLSRG